jgi:hypothetical protein
MEFSMLKKYVFIVVLGLMAVLALSAFRSITYQPAAMLSLSIAPKGVQAPVLSEFAASGDASNFRIAHTWNGVFIPSMNVTGLLPEVARQYQYGPASLATGSAVVSAGSRIVPLAEIFSLNASSKSSFVASSDASNFRIAHTWNGIFIPSMNVTGLLPEVFRQYQYGPASLVTGLAPHNKVNSGH